MNGTRLSAVLLILSTLASCGPPAGDSSARKATTSVNPESEKPSPATARQRRAEARQARELERCDRLRSRVHVTYVISSVPTVHNPQIHLFLVVENASDRSVSGSTTGRLKLAPGPGFREIHWGGSSADILVIEPRAQLRKEIFHDEVAPGRYPVGDRVLWLDAETGLSNGRGAGCEMPADVMAPPGLVDDHPSGRWTLAADGNWHVGPPPH